MRFYAKEAPAYAAVEWSFHNRKLADFLALLPKGGRILDLGCGNGRHAETMLAQGFAVDPTDGVPEMACEAEQRIGRPVRVMRFDQLDAVELYDGIWANACLLHVPLNGLADVLAKVFRALKPGGYHFASYKTGSAAGRDRLDRYYNYAPADAFVALYREAGGWDLVAREEGEGTGYEGQPAPWVAVTVRKRLPSLHES